MASEKTLKFRNEKSPLKIHNSFEWMMRPGFVPGNPNFWPEGTCPIPRRERREKLREIGKKMIKED